MAERNGMMAVPPRALEAIVGFFTPSACREVVLGDLHERYRSPMHYISDAWYAVPCVVYSRIRRTADAGVLLMDGLVLYIAFIAAAWRLDRTLLYGHFGLLKLAIPPAIAVWGLMLCDAYADPVKPLRLRPLLHAGLGIGLACFAQSVFAAARFSFALPGWIVITGANFGLIAITLIGMLFPPSDHKPRGAG